MMPSGIAMGILNPVAGKMYDRIGGRPLALLGFAIMTSAAVLLVTIMNTHTAAAMRTGVPEAAASAIGVRASFRTVAIVCAVCLVASLFIRDRGRRLGTADGLCLALRARRGVAGWDPARCGGVR